MPTRVGLRRCVLRAAARVWNDRVASSRLLQASAPRVLLIRPDHMGDVLLTSPAVELLATALPGAHLTYLVGPWAAEVARHGSPAVTVETLAFPGFTRGRKPWPFTPYQTLWREARLLRTAEYDAALIFRPDHWWGALLALAAGIPRRFGVTSPDTRPFLTHALPRIDGEHAAEESLRLAQAALRTLGLQELPDGASRTTFNVLPEEERAAEALLQTWQVGEHPVAVIHPSAGSALKSWPARRWALVADALSARGLTVVLSGGPEDGALLRELQEHVRGGPASELLGKPLGVVAAVYRRAALVLGPDNGPLHLAAAVGTPTVRLYGPAPPSQFGPWPPEATQRVVSTTRLACVPCGHLAAPPCGATSLPPCMSVLSVEEVLASVDEQLRTPKAQPQEPQS